jgi:Uncharacterized protein conserved in bacteria
MEGRGRLKYFDKSIYQGYFKDNKREGEGIHKYPNGDSYKGVWKNDSYINTPKNFRKSSRY